VSSWWPARLFGQCLDSRSRSLMMAITMGHFIVAILVAASEIPGGLRGTVLGCGRKRPWYLGPSAVLRWLTCPHHEVMHDSALSIEPGVFTRVEEILL
jgi:hypothetical protein